MLGCLVFLLVCVFCFFINLAVFNLTFNRGEGKRLFSMEFAEGVEELLIIPLLLAPFITLMLPLMGIASILMYLAEKLRIWCYDHIALPNWINPEI